MSHSTPSTSTMTRRSLLAGTAAGAAAIGLPLGLSTVAQAAMPPKLSAAGDQSSLCASHHRELSNHLKTILNSSYVYERMKNKVIGTTRCPHCDVGIMADMMDKAAFAAL